MNHLTEKMFVGLTGDLLDVNAAFNFINLDDCGGNSIFVGTTRGYEEDEQKRRLPIEGLFYESYEKMAFKKMIEIVDESMKENEEIKKCYVVHRLGTIKTGEASIIIAACSKSRADCSEETMRILCKIKEQVPVFKKIIFKDGSDVCANREEVLNDKDYHNEIDKKISSNQPEMTAIQKLQTNWILKSEAFWLKK